MKTRSRGVALGALLCAVVLSCACAKRAARRPLADSQTPAGRSAEPDIHGSQFVNTPELRTVRFELDRCDLGREVRETLKQNAAAILGNPRWEVLIEGHCDERGTTEYNLALGQNRAKAVREYYLLLGVPGSRVATLSYGEERPRCHESTEECWSGNRRAESKVKSGVSGVARGRSP